MDGSGRTSAGVGIVQNVTVDPRSHAQRHASEEALKRIVVAQGLRSRIQIRVLVGDRPFSVVDREPVQGLVIVSTLEGHVEIEVREPRVVVVVEPRQLALQGDRVKFRQAVGLDSYDVFLGVGVDLRGLSRVRRRERLSGLPWSLMRLAYGLAVELERRRSGPARCDQAVVVGLDLPTRPRQPKQCLLLRARRARVRRRQGSTAADGPRRVPTPGVRSAVRPVHAARPLRPPPTPRASILWQRRLDPGHPRRVPQ